MFSVGIISCLSKTLFTQSTKLLEATKVALLRNSLAVVLAIISQGENQATNMALP